MMPDSLGLDRLTVTSLFYMKTIVMHVLKVFDKQLGRQLDVGSFC